MCSCGVSGLTITNADITHSTGWLCYDTNASHARQLKGAVKAGNNDLPCASVLFKTQAALTLP